ncbi:RDD family protein [Streptomyces sp. 6N223]|uniref:RDD family protein n=1 Tax=Streptomyces sp. 6N223 TaxID=3457412 RepID=UPI003FCF2A04
MSSPPAGNASGAPGPDWYPDPSIPGYIRYWNGTSWVPGSSRPEPREGEPMPAPPGGAALTAPAPAQRLPAARSESAPPAVPDWAARPQQAADAVADAAASPAQGPEPGEERDREPGPDARPGPDAEPAPGSTLPELRRRGEVAPTRPAGSGGEPAPAWTADARQQQGLGGDRRVTWGSDEDVSTSPVIAAGRVDPRGSFRLAPAEGSPSPDSPASPEEGAPGREEREENAEATGPRDAGRAPGEPDSHERTVGLRLADIQGAASWRQQVHELAQQQSPPDAPATPSVPPALTPPSTSARRPEPEAPAQQAALPTQPAVQPPPQPQPQAQPQPQVPPQHQPQPRDVPAQPGPPPASQGGYGYPGPPADQGGYGYPRPAAQPMPQQPAPPQQVPHQPGPSPLQGHGDSPFVQPDPLTPLITPRSDPAFANPGNAYPAGLGRRLLARIVDSLLPAGGAVAVALPLLGKARDHIDAQIDAAEHAGVTKDIWLIDGTTGGYLAMVVGVFLGLGLLLEALPTGLTGRSLGKAVCGLRVMDVARQDKVSLGAALLRWLVYSVLGLLVIGIVNVLWCLRDRPWRQCWHDKAAGTFVATPPR